jgi:hypothetical protein
VNRRVAAEVDTIRLRNLSVEILSIQIMRAAWLHHQAARLFATCILLLAQSRTTPINGRLR